ncbi:hypothetical protein HMN09_00838600 [Mycena chlorophos]|uniref:Uncharacterized protein n=1 Tax=Mycena chlorophos TaxID=658473 RepID=A0A8H6W678_MYCCL|nr:hypothetical protein HMN09_00838600 [Mycena chlorophos]
MMSNRDDRQRQLTNSFSGDDWPSGSGLLRTTTMAPLSLAQGRLFGALFECLLYGINVILFFVVSYMALGERSKLPRHIGFGYAAVVAIFALCTAHVAAVMRELFVAFFVADVPPDLFYLDHTQPTDLTEKSIYAAVTFAADSLLIFRAYIIFDRSLLAVVFPTCTLLATMVLWIILIHAYAVTTPGTILFPPAIDRLVVASYTMSLVTNLVITLMISIRIWLRIRASLRAGVGAASPYKLYLVPFIESGVIYPISLILEAIFLSTRNNALEVLSGSTAQILGIVPLLLTLHLRLNLSMPQGIDRDTTLDTTTRRPTGMTTTLNFAPHSDDGTATVLGMQDLSPGSRDTGSGDVTSTTQKYTPG